MRVGALPLHWLKACLCWVPPSLVWRLPKALEGGGLWTQSPQAKALWSSLHLPENSAAVSAWGKRVPPSPGTGTATYLHPRQQVREKRTGVTKGASLRVRSKRS